jgi:cysteine synthase
MGDEHKFLLQTLQGEVEKVSDKQDKMLDVVQKQSEILATMQVIQKQHHDSLEEHHRRTTLAEERLTMLERKDHQFQSFVKGAAWVAGGMGTILGLLKYFNL